MKLHLPKQLFTALLAAIILAAPAALTLGSAAWGSSGLHNNSNILLGGTSAGGTNQTPYTNITETTPTGGKLTTTVDKIDASSLSEFNIWADSATNAWTNALVTELRVGNNATIKVSESQWKGTGNALRYFDSLHIQNLDIDGGQATLNITLANHIVTVDTANGTLSSINNAGTLTLGAVALSGNVTNSGTFTIAGTLSGTGTLTNNDNGKVKVDTTNFLAFDGLNYTKADGTSNSVKAGFLSTEQTLQVLGEGVTYTGEVYINDSETGTRLTNGAVTMTIGAVDKTFYVNEAWIYNSTDSVGATAFHVGSAGTLKLTQSLGSLGHAAVTGNGRLEIGYGAGILGAFSEMFTGTLAVVSGGSLQMNSKDINGIDNTVVVDGGHLTLTRNTESNLTRSFDVKNGGTLTLNTTDIMDEGATNTITVTNSTLAVGGNRIASGAGTRYIFNNATVTGAGDSYGALDFNGNATLTSSGASSIAGALRIRPDKTLTLNVSDTLTVGTIVGVNDNSSLTKTGTGTLKITSMEKTNNAFIRGTMAVQAGTVEFALNDRFESATGVYNTFRGALSGSGTVKKSGTADMTMNGNLSTFTGSLEVSGGSLSLTNTSAALNLASVSVGKEAKLTLGSADYSIATLNATGGTLELTGSALTIGSADATTTAHTLAALSGTGSVTLAGGQMNTTQALTIAAGMNLTINEGATLLLGGTLNGTAVDGTANITLNGTVGMAAGIKAADVFTLDSASYSASATETGTTTTSGYLSAATFTLGSNISKGASASLADGFSLTDGVLKYTVSTVDNTTFYVNEDATWGNAGFTDNTAAHYVVAAGKTFDVSWNDNGDYALAGKEITLNENAVLKNTDIDAKTSWKQLKAITLKGNAKVGGTKQFGLLGGSYADTNLHLNGHTLTKEGSNTFLLINTVVDAGTIDISAGTVQVGFNNGSKVTDASGATFNLSGGNLTVNGGDTLKVAGLTGESGTSKINGWGNIELVGSGEYETEAALTGNAKLTVNMNGGSQTLRADSAWGSKTAGNAPEMIALQSGTLNLELDGATLNQSGITKTGGTLNLSGNGIYNMGNNLTATVSGLNESSSWTGTVQLKGITGSNQLDTAFNTLGNENSKLQLTNVEGYFDATSNGANVSPNLHLVNETNSDGAVTAAAIYITNGNSDATAGSRKAVISGDISGSGDIVFKSWSTDSKVASYNFTGNVQEWDGSFSVVQNGSNALGANVIFSGDATLINADVRKDDRNTGTKLYLEIGKSDEPRQYTMNGTVAVDKLTVNQTTTFTDLVTVYGAVTNTSELKLGTAATVTGGTMNKVSMSTAGISTSATDGTRGSISNAGVEIAQLAEDASFTIEDMTLTNTTVTAATVETKVKLQNVEGSTALLAKGAFTLHAAPTVGMAPTAENHGTLSYTNGLAIATDKNASLTLNLDVVNAVAGDEHGTYDLTITLSGFGEGFAVTENILNMVGFDSTSWLGQALVSQKAEYTVVTEQTPAPTGEGGVPTVSYAAGTGANVGSLVITISGLNVPEPASATLGLAALMMLCARRRRKA